ncbi:MAG: hypothetical protein LBE46_01635 [Wolbachia pipientis]|nr:hypothetical protein [Wolbachia pipientis]
MKGKVDNNQCKELENKKLNEEVEKLRKEIRELYEKEDKFYKERDILRKKEDTLYKERDILYEEEKKLHTKLDDLKCEIRKINKEKENLSQELKEKFEELDEANDCINDQFFELDGIRKDCNNEVKNLLLKQDTQIAQLEGGLKEVVSLIQRAIQHIACEIERPIKRSRDNNIEAVLKKVSGEIQVIKSLLEELKETAVQHLPELVKDSEYASLSDETSVSLYAGDRGYGSEKDSGYNSHSSTPTKPSSLLKEVRNEYSQSNQSART